MTAYDMSMKRYNNFPNPLTTVMQRLFKLVVFDASHPLTHVVLEAQPPSYALALLLLTSSRMYICFRTTVDVYPSIHFNDIAH